MFESLSCKQQGTDEVSSTELCFERIHQAMICRMDCKVRGMGSKEAREKVIAVIWAGGVSVWTRAVAVTRQ